ncbi:MAG: alpha-galactosidase [Spirochaetales bacterium]|nr:alpha-galactosidase [Spirochaetales bacterium]
MKVTKAWLLDMNGKCYEAETLKEGETLSVYITPSEGLKARRMCVEFDIDIREKRVLAHGFQSWTESFVADKNSCIKPLNFLASSLLKMDSYGDYHFYRSKGKRGTIHSHEYLRVFDGPECDENEIFFAGNLRPEHSYGIFEVDFIGNKVTYFTDLEGLELEANVDFTGIDLYLGTKAEMYFDYRKLSCGNLKRLTGWTSWYNYYTKISEKILFDNLDNLAEKKVKIDVFQIDDGFQKAVGDWLEINDKFPNGMKAIADKVKEKNMKPGLWLAPFSCEKTSNIYKNHREMLIRDDRDRPIVVGFNPGWSYFFYGLNIYNSGTRDYLKEVFSTVVNDWGYDFLKLDFLYSAAIRPYPGKTRAMVMHDALSYLNEIRGDAQMLGCGCPIGVAAGMMEYMRIGADVAPYWEDKLLKTLSYRERVSTAGSLVSTRNRFFLNKRAFMNDPDVFILRNTSEIKMTAQQKKELYDCNMKYSGMIFFSDDVSSYDKDTLKLVKTGFAGVK